VKSMMIPIRWSLVFLLFIGLTKDLVSPYVTFQLPAVIKNNATSIFCLCIFFAFVIQIKEALLWVKLKPNSAASKSISLAGYLQLLAITVFGIVVSAIFTTMLAVLHGWFSENDISLTFLAWSFFLALGVWYSLPLNASIKLPIKLSSK